MGFDTIIVNGRVVTATDTYSQRHRHHQRQDRSHRQRIFRARMRRRSSTRTGNLFCPAASMCTRISTCPSAAPPAPTISKPARAPRLSAAPPRSSISPSSTKARRCAPLSIPGCRKASGKAVSDYAFHCIITDSRARAARRDERPGARRRHQLQAVHGVSGRLHARRRQHLQSLPQPPRRTADWSACTPKTAARST